MEKIRRRMFLLSDLTVTGVQSFSGSSARFTAPYGTSAPTMDTNGQINVAHVSNRGQLVLRSGGTTYTLQFPTASNGTVTITVA